MGTYLILIYTYIMYVQYCICKQILWIYFATEEFKDVSAGQGWRWFDSIRFASGFCYSYVTALDCAPFHSVVLYFIE